MSNKLINESSPYLLQHAGNPVNWIPWNDDAWQKAIDENKPVLVSIGYSSCHWCHVMEKESFEDLEVASLMNEYFICIKVDREERPDVDQLYMAAVQLLTGSGGWPLNCFCLPDKQPFYGGTYFPKSRWINLLDQIQNLFHAEQNKASEYASELTQAIMNAELSDSASTINPISFKDIDDCILKWGKTWDTIQGGSSYVPKFPMPNNLECLLMYSHLSNEESKLDYVRLTLSKIANGGIYDHLAGGFARYSTDAKWKVPHFEKMLYDNAQLVTVYSKAFQKTGEPLFRKTAVETLDFVRNEMTDDSGGFYSAIDADSENEEGKYYVWSREELQKLLGKDFNVFADYYSVNDAGYWENGNYILLRSESDEVIKQKHKIDQIELTKLIASSKEKLLSARKTRTAPFVDKKIITSWNALMSTGYIHAYRAFQNLEFLKAAEKNIQFLINQLLLPGSELKRIFMNGKSSVPGFIDDYAFLIETLINAYEVTFNAEYLNLADRLTQYCNEYFADGDSPLYYFSSAITEKILFRKIETQDNVIPSGNSCMAKNLFRLGKLLSRDEYIEQSKKMIHQVTSLALNYPTGYSNWLIGAMYGVFPFYEVVVTGPDAAALKNNLIISYLPNTVMAGSADEKSDLPLLQKRLLIKDTLIHICQQGQCYLPVKTIHEALHQIKGNHG